ncbi:MAG: class I tRNA ligase family protein [Candidatus Paceibacterota bacterium]|nr:MAG: class I tRNA ligase family protein [Candidatus Paceibacterota bacterium]
MLHIGHAYEDALQDAIIRYQRMRGKRALWVPGTDSAAMATQPKVEKIIQKEEGKNRHEIGREELRASRCRICKGKRKHHSLAGKKNGGITRLVPLCLHHG